MSDFRHEFKYVISNYEKQIIQNRIEKMLAIDRNAKENGEYNISSLYFDTYNNQFYYENQNGVSPRTKYRIRIYNHCTDRIVLEKKSKVNNMCNKVSCEITAEQVEAILKGEELMIDNDSPKLLKELKYMMLSRGLKPKTIVEYDRIPYTYNIGNIRITFDQNLSSSIQVEDFLLGAKSKRPVMEHDKLLLEVKYDELLPDYIKSGLNIENLTQTAFSKYYLCRYFSM